MYFLTLLVSVIASCSIVYVSVSSSFLFFPHLLLHHSKIPLLTWCSFWWFSLRRYFLFYVSSPWLPLHLLLLLTPLRCHTLHLIYLIILSLWAPLRFSLLPPSSFQIRCVIIHRSRPSPPLYVSILSYIFCYCILLYYILCYAVSLLY